MTFKNVFDQALAKCTEFNNDMYNARDEFIAHVNEILNQELPTNPYFIGIRAWNSWTKSICPAVRVHVASQESGGYNAIDLLKFKVKLERGQKHTSYFNDYTEYRAKGYADISIGNLDAEQSAKMFDTAEILDVLKYFYETNVDVKYYTQLNEKYTTLANTITQEHSALIDTLKTAILEFNTLDEDAQKYIRKELEKTTGKSITRW